MSIEELELMKLVLQVMERMQSTQQHMLDALKLMQREIATLAAFQGVRVAGKQDDLEDVLIENVPEDSHS